MCKSCCKLHMYPVELAYRLSVHGSISTLFLEDMYTSWGTLNVEGVQYVCVCARTHKLVPVCLCLQFLK